MATTKKNEEKKTKSNVEFDDQSFLWDHIDLFQNRGPTSQGRASPFLYKNFLQINDDQPLTTKNRLFAMGIDALNSVTTAQLSSIVPYFRLFKVLPQKPNVGGNRNRTRIEFPFNKFTTMESILQSRENRGTDVGLKNVRWEDLGANPANVGLAFKGSMTLHFQSFEGIFKTRKVDGEDIRFADIMHLESLIGKNAQKNPTSQDQSRANSSNVNCNTTTEIHMECGWTLPPGTSKKDMKFAEELKKLRRTYIITPLDQSIKVTNNGAVDMDIEFAAAIEGRTFGTSTDLLSIDETNTDDPLSNEIVALKANIEKYRKEQKANKESRKAANKADQSKQSKSAREEARNKRKELRENIRSSRSGIRAKRYKRFISLLQNKSKNRVFYVDLESPTIETYKKLLEHAAKAYDQSKKSTKQEKIELQDELRDKRAEILGKIKISGAGKGSTLLMSNLDDPTKIVSKEDMGKNLEQLKKKSTAEPGESYRLHYIYLGDIIEAAMEIIYEDPHMEGGKKVSNKNACPQLRTDVRLLMGPFSYLDPSSGEIRNMQLADVPISFSYFNAWFYDNVIKRNKDNYPLRTFLRDVCGKLLNNVMSPKRYGGMPGKRLRCSVQSVFTKQNHPLDQAWKRSFYGLKPRVSVQDIFKDVNKGSANQHSQWLYIYVVGGETRNSLLNGKIDEDLDRNIPHYFVGADTGVIKNIDFTKTKIPGKRESLIFRSVNDGPVTDNLLFSDRYDAKIRLLGNPIFKPGMLIYIDPRAMGLGISDISPADYMSALGVGGYYRVVRVHSSLDSSKFETELGTISEFSSREIAEAKKKVRVY